jgi:hypothetical protein
LKWGEYLLVMKWRRYVTSEESGPIDDSPRLTAKD